MMDFNESIRRRNGKGLDDSDENRFVFSARGRLEKVVDCFCKTGTCRAAREKADIFATREKKKGVIEI